MAETPDITVTLKDLTPKTHSGDGWRSRTLWVAVGAFLLLLGTASAFVALGVATIGSTSPSSS